MRIVHYIDNLDSRLGGIVRAVSNMVDCQRCRLDVTLAVRQSPARTPFTIDGGQNVVTLTSRQFSGPLLTPKTLRNFAEVLEGADALHLHSVWDPANAQLASVARRHKVNVFLSPHGAFDAWPMTQKRSKKLAYLRLVRRNFLDRLAVIHGTCEREADSARALLPGSVVHVVPLPLDQASYEMAATPEPAQRPGNRQSMGLSITFLGRIHPKKRVDRTVEALAELLGHGLQARLTIVGTGPRPYQSYIEKRIRALGLESHVEMLGFVPPEQTRFLLAASDAVIAPSEHENFGFVCFEALAAGTPLITTSGVMTSDQLAESGGAVVSGTTPEELAASIMSIADESTRVRMGRRGRRWLLDELDSATLAGRYAAMYGSPSSIRTPTLAVTLG